MRIVPYGTEDRFVFFPGLIKIMSLSMSKLGQVYTQAYKMLGFPKLKALHLCCNPEHVQHPSGPLHIALWEWGPRKPAQII